MSDKKRTVIKKNKQLKEAPSCRYIFVVGGVMSGIGKGITTASIGVVLQSHGLKVSLMKADPYLNVDAGTMNPTEHGEVFVLDSGLETDQDMGNYERFLNLSLSSDNYMTNGMIFKYVIDKERALGYKGKCVEPTYHITEEVLRRIENVRKFTRPDVIIVEIGGTVGEYQNAIFLEAARQLRLKDRSKVQFVMVSYLPIPAKLGEMKTKPTQNAVRQLNSYGINPDFIIARAESPIDLKRRQKIADMCGIDADHVISAPDVGSIYEVPLVFDKAGLAEQIMDSFGLPFAKNEMKPWKRFVTQASHLHDRVRIALPGKYFNTGDYVLSDAYLSIIEALKASATHLKVKVDLSWVSVQELEKGEGMEILEEFDGVLIPGGFGETGIAGKINVIQNVRENKIPYLGICYGMQLMIVEYARNVLGWHDAHTTEINPKTKHPVVDIMEHQKDLLSQGMYGASMRLGSYPAIIKKGTHAFQAYKKSEITERHRHRYEVNPLFVPQLEEAGLVFSGVSPDGALMEIAELPKDVHPFFVGTQFHPEFLARPLDPHPLFVAFMKAVIDKSRKK